MERGINVQDAAIQILKDAGKPLHAKEIAERIIEAGLWSSDGKTSEATVSARLYADIKKRGLLPSRHRQRKGLIDTKLPIVRRFLIRFKRYIRSCVAKNLMENEHGRSQFIEGQSATEPFYKTY